MARIAFYAPLKSPHHPVVSGEREMARNLMAALSGEGRSVELVSEFRTLEKVGDADRQAALLTQAQEEIASIQARGGWDAWVTYHNYYKAPDLIGPEISAALGIPYLVIESTRASKRLTGPWADFESRAAAACDHADVLFYLTQRDSVALRANLKPGQSLVHLPPFLPEPALPTPARVQASPIVLLAGMMRPGDKLASYEIAAEVLQLVPDGPWRVEIAGDGPARAQVQALMAPLGRRVSFLGELDKVGMQAAYQRASALLWPGVNEAFGMVYLEAQAAGVPVVAQDRVGVCDVVAPDGLFPPDDMPALAEALERLLNERDYHRRRAQNARDKIAESHLLGAARATLWGALGPLIPEAI